MERIFSSSKLFNSYSSVHQSKIRAAAGDAKNAELVKQLVQYLDEEYRKPEYVNPKALEKKVSPTKEHDNAEPHSEEDDNYSEMDRPSGSPSHVSPKRPFTDAMMKDAARDGEDNDTERVYVQEEASSEIGTDEVTEATDISDSEKDYQKLKPLLESSESTAGVNRVAKKDNEVWIYYGDRFNLNNLMSDVVDALNIHGYNELDFNRLARMDNAIVFVIHEK